MQEKLKKLKRVLDYKEDPLFVLQELDSLHVKDSEIEKKIETIELTPGPKGDSIKGEPGDPGRDYILTETDKAEIASKIEVPIVEKVIEKVKVIHEQPIIEQKITNEIKEVAVTDTPEQIVEKLNSLEEVIDASVIKGLTKTEDIIKQIKKGKLLEPRDIKGMPLNFNDLRWHGGGISSIVAGSGITAVDDGSGHITVSAPGSTTDEKVKYDSGDPTAGYLADKVVAGSGVTLEEGTGADENKLKINALASGGMKSWFFTKTASDVGLPTYKATTTLPPGGIQTITTTAVKSTETVIASFLTEIQTSEYRVIDGSRFFYVTAETDNNHLDITLIGRIYTTDINGANPVLLRTSNYSVALTQVPTSISINAWGSALLIPTTTRVKFVISALNIHNQNHDVTLRVEDDTFSRLDVPSPVGVTDISGLLKLNQTTPQTIINTGMAGQSVQLMNGTYAVNATGASKFQGVDDLGYVAEIYDYSTGIIGLGGENSLGKLASFSPHDVGGTLIIGDTSYHKLLHLTGTSWFEGNVLLGAGSATAGTSPLKFTSGNINTASEEGAMEYNGEFYLTDSDGRYKIALSNGTSAQFKKGDGSLDSANYLSTSQPYTVGDIFYADTTSTIAKVTPNSATGIKFLSQGGTGTSALPPSWQTVPTLGAYTYYLTNTVDSGAVLQMIQNNAGSIASKTFTAITTDTLVGTWITTTGHPNLTNIPAGIWRFHLDATITTGAGKKAVRAYIKVYKDVGGTPTLLFTTQNSDTIITTDTTNPQELDVEYLMTAITLNSTDRIKAEVYVVPSGTGTAPSGVIYYQGNTLSRVEFPSETISADNFVPYVGATSNLNLGTRTIGAGVATFSDTGANTPVTPLTLNDLYTATSGAVSSTVGLDFNFTQSINSVASLHQAGRIEAYKVKDWFHASAETDTSSGLKFYTTNAGTPTLQLTIDEVGLATFANHIVVGDVSGFTKIFSSHGSDEHLLVFDSTNHSTAVGSGCHATGLGSASGGFSTDATGTYSTAWGHYSTASGNSASVFGYYSQAGGDYSLASGYYASAGASASVAVGHGVSVGGSASSSMALGVHGTVANTFSTIIGTFNSDYAAAATDYLITIGGYNGSSDATWITIDRDKTEFTSCPKLPDYTAVSNYVEGMIAFDYTNHIPMCYTGSGWVAI